MTFGEWTKDEPVMMRIHSECLTGDALFSLRCDCGPQLEKALQDIANNGSGILLYLRQEGRGIGLINKIKAYKLQDEGKDTVDANIHLGFDSDLRNYDLCKTMLDHLGVQKINLLTNNPRKVKALEDMGFDVNRTAIITGHNEANEKYISTKRQKLGHMIP